MGSTRSDKRTAELGASKQISTGLQATETAHSHACASKTHHNFGRTFRARIEQGKVVIGKGNNFIDRNGHAYNLSMSQTSIVRHHLHVVTVSQTHAYKRESINQSVTSTNAHSSTQAQPFVMMPSVQDNLLAHFSTVAHARTTSVTSLAGQFTILASQSFAFRGDKFLETNKRTVRDLSARQVPRHTHKKKERTCIMCQKQPTPK